MNPPDRGKSGRPGAPRCAWSLVGSTPSQLTALLVKKSFGPSPRDPECLSGRLSEGRFDGLVLEVRPSASEASHLSSCASGRTRIAADGSTSSAWANVGRS